MKTSSLEFFHHIKRFVAVIILIYFTGCLNTIDKILDNDDDTSNVDSKIVLHQTGGFAGISKLTTIEETNDSITVTTVDDRPGQTLEGQLSKQELGKLWQILETNDAFTLPSNDELLDTVADAFFFEISVERGQARNQFVVYGPSILAADTDEKRYTNIVEAIQSVGSAVELIIDDLPISDVKLQIMESFPIQVAVEVSGILRDGCTRLHEIKQGHQGNTIYIQITTARPKDASCIQVVTEIQERVFLGSFPPGDYAVIVNGVERKFRG